MTAITGKQRSVGLRNVSAFVLSSEDGFPTEATDASIYTGLEFEGGLAFSINTSNNRPISHTDGDIVQQIDFLPPSEGATGELRVGIDNQTVNSALMGVNEYTLGEAKIVDWQTSEQGDEPDIALVMYQQSLDSASSRRRWRAFIADLARAIPKASNFDENKSETTYSIALSPSSKHFWGATRVSSTEGNTKAAFSTGMFEGKPQFGFAVGDAVTVEFLFPTDKPALSVDKIQIFDFDTGLEITSGITKAVTGVIWASAPNLTRLAFKWEF